MKLFEVKVKDNQLVYPDSLSDIYFGNYTIEDDFFILPRNRITSSIFSLQKLKAFHSFSYDLKIKFRSNLNQYGVFDVYSCGIMYNVQSSGKWYQPVYHHTEKSDFVEFRWVSGGEPIFKMYQGEEYIIKMKYSNFHKVPYWLYTDYAYHSYMDFDFIVNGKNYLIKDYFLFDRGLSSWCLNKNTINKLYFNTTGAIYSDFTGWNSSRYRDCVEKVGFGNFRMIGYDLEDYKTFDPTVHPNLSDIYFYDSKRITETYYSNEFDPKIKAYVY